MKHVDHCASDQQAGHARILEDLGSPGQKVLSLRTVAGQGEKPGKVLRADSFGFSLLTRVFDIDVERCACGGQTKMIAATEALVVIVRIGAMGNLNAAPPLEADAVVLILSVRKSVEH